MLSMILQLHDLGNLITGIVIVAAGDSVKGINNKVSSTSGISDVTLTSL